MLAGEPWGAFPKLIRQDGAIGHYPNINGAGESIAIIDTGVDYKHPALGGGFGPGYKVVAGYDFVDDDPDPMDPDGHGTGVAGIIGANDFVYAGSRYRGLAPKANIIALRAMDNDSSDDVEDSRIEQALQWVIAHRTQYNIVAVNISDGTGEFSGPTRTGPYWDELQTLANSGVFIAAASGNNGVQSPYSIEYPAADPNAYAIGSINSSDVISSFTERSADLDLLAPGESIPTTYYDPATRKHIYLAATGTSFATPFAAAAAALLKQADSSLSPSQIMDILAASGSSNFDGDKERGTVTNMTFPRLNIDAAIGMALRSGDDSFEENDSLSAAKTLNFSGDSAGADNLRLMASDNDFYKFTLSTSGRVSFFLDTSDGAQPTFELYSGSGTKIATLGASATRDLAAGTYVLKVSAFSSTMSGTYSIDIDKTSDDVYEANNSASAATRIGLSGGSGHLGNLRLLGGNDDYYSFNLSGPSDVTISLSYDGNSSFPGATLLDSSQRTLQHLSQGGNSRSLSGGTYYVHLSSSQTLDGTYSIDVSAATAAPPAFYGSVNDIAVDSGGRLHLVFYDTHSHNLEYVTRSASGIWSDVKVVDKSATSVPYVSLALDHKGQPGIAYYDANNADLKYAHLSGATFSVTRIDARGAVGEFPSLAFSSANKPAISYYSRSGGNLKLAMMGKTKWSVSTIDSAGNVGRYTSLAFNAKTGGWGIGYLNATTGMLRYAARSKTGALTFANIEKIGSGGGYISLAVDSKGRPAMSYFVSNVQDLHYARFDGRKWNKQVVASSGSVGQYSNLVLDSSGGANIFFYNQTTNAPMLATLRSKSWSLSSIARGGGTFLSAASGPGSSKTFVYRDSATGTLLTGAV
ncbi:MAG TPA: S8 family serine peptidase [Tepidisphaeraceae bacterium]|nr:S8 family serine peptidase [Tepidisphaeraceae bacterium]